MYCPKCFNNSLQVNSRGVMHIVINGKQMDAGRFLYDFADDKGKFIDKLNAKLVEFFKWYSNFQNSTAITKIEICTSDVCCENKCHIPITSRFSIVDEILSSREIEVMLEKLGNDHGLEIELLS